MQVKNRFRRVTEGAGLAIHRLDPAELPDESEHGGSIKRPTGQDEAARARSEVGIVRRSRRMLIMLEDSRAP